MSLKDRLIKTKEKIKAWTEEHQGDVIYYCYVGACIVAMVGPVIAKIQRAKTDTGVDRRIYDRSNGWYWETKNITNRQKMIIEERHQAGESYGKILSDMKLLKR